MKALGSGARTQMLAMPCHRKTLRNLQGGPKAVLASGDRGVGAANNDVPGKWIVLKHPVEGRVELFGGDDPGDQRALGKTRCQKCLTNPADVAGPEHGDDSLDHDRGIDPALPGDLPDGIGAETRDAVLRYGEDSGIDGIVYGNWDCGGHGLVIGPTSVAGTTMPLLPKSRHYVIITACRCHAAVGDP